MFKLAAVLALAAVASAASVEMQMDTMRSFTQWKRDYAAVYETAEAETAAFHNFQERMAFINKHNAEAAEGKHTYTVGMNQFMDLSQQDFKRFYTSRFNRTTARNTVYLPAATEDSVDWRTKGAVTPVKNQGQCGSCWSFSTTGSTEGAHAIASGKLVSLSEQQLCDCSTSYGNQGCNGGLMDNAFKYIIANGGLDTEEDYPYTARDGTCDKAKAAKKVVSITGYQDVPQNNEDQLAAAVAKGPVSVAIEADQMGFQTYKSGVFSGNCGTQLDHGVLVVGYSDDYWIVKNSWGASWGDEGYIMMKRGVSASGICGIAMEPSYPTVSSGDDAAPNDGDYGKPPCPSSEQPVRITGVSGEFCSPSCSASSPCPTDVPAGTTAKPECVLEMPGHSSPTNCALICNPSTGGCPSGATCQAISGTGVCTYA
jgi:C1A family cysteine protease